VEHIAQIDFEAFYRPVFPSAASAQEFVRCVEAIPPQQSKAKIVLHQAGRMLWLADRIERFARGRPALLILFYVIAAEAVAKLVKGFQGKGHVKDHVRIFFEDICSDRDRSILSNAFSADGWLSTLTLSEAVDLLYEVRCDVAHEGRYFTFTLPEPSDSFQVVTTYKNLSLEPRITAHDIRQIVLHGAVLGAARLLPAGSPCLKRVPKL